MKTSPRLHGILPLAFLLLSAPGASAMPEGGNPCNPMLVRTTLIPSGREGSKILEANTQAAREIDELADRLGVSRADHEIEFVPSTELAVLASLGRHPVGHWRDGSIAATQAASVAGVLEFVAGCPICRSYYRDTSTREEQVEILKHVAFHNDFALHSIFSKIRLPYDPLAASRELYDLIESARRGNDPDEVSQWYQYLLTLSRAQDLARGSFDSPESLAKQNPASAPPTASELQYTVAHFPHDLPDWKRRIAVKFEQMERIVGYYASTKFMNEGWATLGQDLMAPYLPYQDHHHLIEAAELKSGVSYPGIGNPYWIGREAWRVLREKFNARPEIRPLSRLEQDKRFIQYAHRIMGQYDDFAFLQFALDDKWVFKNNLFLYRTAEPNERDLNLPLPPPGKKPQEQKVVTSTDPREVLFAITTQLVDRTLQIPRVLIEGHQVTGRSVVSLQHEAVAGIPLKFGSAVQALYVRTQIWQKPVSLKTFVGEFTQSGGWTEVAGSFEWVPPKTTFQNRPIRIEVDPLGHAQVYDRPASGPETLNAELTERASQVARFFIEDLSPSLHTELEETQLARFLPLIAQVADQATDPAMNLFPHDPTSATALIRYYEMVERRFHNAMQRAIQGKLGLRKTSTGVRVRMLPLIPQFELDEEIRARLIKNGSIGARVSDSRTETASPFSDLIELAMRQSRASTLDPLAFAGVDVGKGHAPPKKGEHFWGDKDDDGDGDGSGDGDEDGDEDGKRPGKGRKPGNGEGSPSDIDVPLEIYGEFLKEEIELPNLRPKSGPSDRIDTQKEGAMARSHGEVLWNRVVPKALVLGKMALAKRGINPDQEPKRVWLREGMKLIQPSDYVVVGREKAPLPDVNAVVVIWMDMTGSMMGKPIELAKQFMFNLRALLSTKYKRVTFRYIGFTTVAQEFADEKTFFRSFMNGGTDYSSGIMKAAEIVHEYDPRAYDRFSFGIGDAEDGNPMASSEQLRSLVELTQYSAFVQTKLAYNSPNPQFMGTVLDLAADETAFFGHAALTEQMESGLEVLRQILGKDRRQ